MKHLTTLVPFCLAVGVGLLSGGIERRVSERPVIPAATALSVSGWGTECPGGVSPACVVCGGKGGVECIAACTGDFTCERLRDPDTHKPEGCMYTQGVCRTINPVPTFGWAASYVR